MDVYSYQHRQHFKSLFFIKKNVKILIYRIKDFVCTLLVYMIVSNKAVLTVTAIVTVVVVLFCFRTIHVRLKISDYTCSF